MSRRPSSSVLRTAFSASAPYPRRTPGQPRVSRQRFSACGECCMRRVRCDLKDLSTSAVANSSQQPSCSNCRKRDTRCVYELAEVKAIKSLTRRRRLQQINHGKVENSESPQTAQALLDHSSPLPPTGEPTLLSDGDLNNSTEALSPSNEAVLSRSVSTCNQSTLSPTEYAPDPIPASVGFLLPLDLTPHVVKVSDQYFAGEGFGDVYQCWCHGDSVQKIQVAVKAFRFKFTLAAGDTDESSETLRRELVIWKGLDHVNVVPFLGIAYGFGLEGAMSLVSLWMPNDTLDNFLTIHDNNLGVAHRLQLSLDIANGLKYLHSLGIVHGDLNCNNVLLDANYIARVSDFGYASLVENIPEASSYLQWSTTRPGALRWAAPEQINAGGTFSRTTKSDIYAFGCLALQVLSGKHPWSEVGEDVAVVLRLALGCKPGRPESRPVDDLHWDLIEQCLSTIPERPTAETITVSIQRFLGYCPPVQPLHEIVGASDDT